MWCAGMTLCWYRGGTWLDTQFSVRLVLFSYTHIFKTIWVEAPSASHVGGYVEPHVIEGHEP